MQNDTRIALDIAKAVFDIAVSNNPGRVVGAVWSRQQPDRRGRQRRLT
jgi:hypothetical protein